MTAMTEKKAMVSSTMMSAMMAPAAASAEEDDKGKKKKKEPAMTTTLPEKKAFETLTKVAGETFVSQVLAEIDSMYGVKESSLMPKPQKPAASSTDTFKDIQTLVRGAPEKTKEEKDRDARVEAAGNLATKVRGLTTGR